MTLAADPFSERTGLLLGAAALATLRSRHVVIAGVGGVGSYAAEAIARAGVGRITLLDHDQVAPSNLNRQLVALRSTVGRPKTEVMAQRIADIDPEINVHSLAEFLRPENVAELVPADADYVLDCIDSIACKAALVAGLPEAGSAGDLQYGSGWDASTRHWYGSDCWPRPSCARWRG
jgi:tRNA threonylcarbamoyladenosine dehydratase